MTKTTMDLTELLQKHDQGDLLRSIAEAVLQLMMESDVDGLTNGKFSVMMDRVGSSERSGYAINLEHRF
uniref:hypothetical protein n=1 Tax=Yoonia sp. TaxID=2212373 RepID=UPI0040472FE2